jgi:hypothetical protein
MCAGSSLRKQTMLVRVPLSAYFYVAQADERALAVAFINKLCSLESHYRHIFYVAQADERALAVAFVNKLLVRVPLSACFYVALADERALAEAFINKLCWFKSHYQHIFYVA